MPSFDIPLGESPSQGAEDAVFGGVQYPITATESEVIDLRSASQYVVYGASGTPTQQPCDSAGTALPGTSAANVTRGAVNYRLSHYVEITAGAADVTVLVF